MDIGKLGEGKDQLQQRKEQDTTIYDLVRTRRTTHGIMEDGEYDTIWTTIKNDN